MRHPLLPAIVAVTAFFALYLPSSVGGVISRPLSILSIGGTCVLLALAALAGRRQTPALLAAAALAVITVPTLFTITSPFEQTSAGVVMLYVAQTLLFMVDLRGVRSRLVVTAFSVITAISLALGYALVANASPADRAMLQWYAAFYPELISNMVGIDDKPVLTFATHSMAGFMIYLFFYLHWRAWLSGGGPWRVGAAAGLFGLLLLLRSTTGQAFAVIAALQVAMHVWQAATRLRPLMMVAGSLAVIAGAAVAGIDPGDVVDRVRDAVVGDRIRGLFSRYAADGLLASNMRYLSESPLRPIGFGATDSLYLGDSGLIVNLLRGSVPLLLAVYGGLWLFLRRNLSDSRAATWIWACTVLFEIGFTPLQYFRFVGVLPLLVVFLNSTAGASSLDATHARDNISGIPA